MSTAVAARGWVRLRRGLTGLGPQVVVAMLAGLGWYAACALLTAALSETPALAAVLLVVGTVTAVAVVTRRADIAYAAPIGVAGSVAIDWHLIPPTHTNWLPTGFNVPALAAYLVTGALLGALAHTLRERVARSERRSAALAREQAALREVATVVATEAPPASVFAAVASGVRSLLGVDVAVVLRDAPDGTATVAAWDGGPGGRAVAVGTVVAPTGALLPAGGAGAGPVPEPEPGQQGGGPGDPVDLAALLRRSGVRWFASSEVARGQEPWGAVLAGSTSSRTPPGDHLDTLVEFTHLTAIGIANAEARLELQASRRRLVTASDEARRLLERDLHDGVQQRLVALGLSVAALESSGADAVGIRAGLGRVRRDLGDVVEELRQVSHGIHPAAVSSGGLRPALASLARRAQVSAEVRYRGEAEMPEPVLVAAYYVVAECLTNVAKHTRAARVVIDAEAGPDRLRISVADDGSGEADLSHGTGLTGLRDRTEALGGTFAVTSEPGRGTTVRAAFPLGPVPDEAAEPPAGRGERVASGR